ncbi:MAG: type VI secretion system contractile sheath large subunit, partial [Planctomycetota bacterium]|nr:type VI secretion system contractile sheath large subunit [Planctomycetota bacterium]
MGDGSIEQGQRIAPSADAVRADRPGGERSGPALAPPGQAILVEAAIAATAGGRDEAADRLNQFLAAPPDEALKKWLAWSLPPGRRIARDDVVEMLGCQIARLDALITDQLNAILHHERFQKLEASWRGLNYLIDQADDVENLKVRLLNLAWKELARDVQRATEFDQSQLFRKIYSEEFDTPGGEPFGVLIGDYEIHPRASAAHPIDDV